MRFLKDVQYELDAKGEAALASRLEAFLRVGQFTLSEWESLSPKEQELAGDIQRALKLETLLLQRQAFSAGTIEEAASLLQAAGDVRSASRMLLRHAVESVAVGEVRV